MEGKYPTKSTNAVALSGWQWETNLPKSPNSPHSSVERQPACSTKLVAAQLTWPTNLVGCGGEWGAKLERTIYWNKTKGNSLKE